MAADKTANGSKQKKSEMPRGGRKGGKIFPRITLEQALTYSKRLVSKTAVAPQPEATVLAGVFDNAGSEGKIRLSALKQFGLIKGTAAAYEATPLAKEIEIAADETERMPLLRRALLTPKIFQEVYNTYQGDQASRAKIKGRVQQLKVHPEAAENCTEVFVSSAITAGLATSEGDGVRLLTQIGQETNLQGDTQDPDIDPVEEQTPQNPDIKKTNEAVTNIRSGEESKRETYEATVPRPRTAADVAVNLTVDSSLDGEKLEKQLVLLRRYGLI